MTAATDLPDDVASSVAHTPRRYSVNWYGGWLQMSDLPTVRDFANGNAALPNGFAQIGRLDADVAFDLVELGNVLDKGPVATLRLPPAAALCR